MTKSKTNATLNCKFDLLSIDMQHDYVDVTLIGCIPCKEKKVEIYNMSNWQADKQCSVARFENICHWLADEWLIGAL